MDDIFCSACFSDGFTAAPFAGDQAVGAIQSLSQSSILGAVPREALQAAKFFACCPQCNRRRNRHVQSELGRLGMVEVLADVLRHLASDSAPSNDDIVVDMLQILASMCTWGSANTHRLYQANGWSIMKDVLACRSMGPPKAQACCLQILTNLACLESAEPVYIMDVLATASNMLQQQQQQQGLSGQQQRVPMVLEAAAWCLSVLAAEALQGQQRLASEQGRAIVQQHLWPMLSGQMLRVVVEELRACPYEEYALIQHLMSYVHTIASSSPTWLPPRRSPASSPTIDSSQQQQQQQVAVITSLLSTAGNVVSARVAAGLDEHLVLSGALRCLQTLLACPLPLHLEPTPRDLAELALAAMRRSSAAAGQGGNQAGQQVPCETFLAQIHGLILVGELLQRGRLGAGEQPPPAARLSDIHDAVRMAMTFLQQQQGRATEARACPEWKLLPEQANMEAADSTQPGCRLGHRCWGAHWHLKGTDIAAAAAAAAALLQWVGGPAALNSVDISGSTMLHKLACTGQVDAVLAFIRMGGADLDLGRLDAMGTSAAQLARSCNQHATAQLLDAAATGQFLQRQSGGGAQPQVHGGPFMPRQQGSMISSASTPNLLALGQHMALGHGLGGGKGLWAPGPADPAAIAPRSQRPSVNFADTGAPAVLDWPPSQAHMQQQQQPQQQASIWQQGQLTQHQQRSLQQGLPRGLQMPQGLSETFSGQSHDDPVLPTWERTARGGGLFRNATATVPLYMLAQQQEQRQQQQQDMGAHQRGLGLPRIGSSQGLLQMAAAQQQQQQAPAAGAPDENWAAALSSGLGAQQPLQHSDSHGAEDPEASFMASSDGCTLMASSDLLCQLLQNVANGTVTEPLPGWLAAGLEAAVREAGGPPVADAGIAGQAGLDVDATGNLLAASTANTAEGELANSSPSRHLWLGNLNTRLPRAVLKAVFEHFGNVEDVVTFPGRMYAFVNFKTPEDAAKAVVVLNEQEVPPITGNRKLVVKFRPSKKALGKLADSTGVGDDNDDEDAAAAVSSDDAAAAAAGLDDGEGSGGEAEAAAAAVAALVLGRQTAEREAAEEAANAAVDLAALLKDVTVATDKQDSGLAAAAKHSLSGTANSESGADHTPRSSIGVPTDEGLAGIASGSGADGGLDAAYGSGDCGSDDGGMDGEGEGKPSRHLWLGNIPLRPNKAAMELLFGSFGTLESVRVFPGKTFAFVNYLDQNHAMAAKAALDGQSAPAVTGSKPLAIRFQKDTSSVPAALLPGSPPTSKLGEPRRTLGTMSNSSSVANLTALPALASVGNLARLLDEDASSPEPAINLSNRLNPNNVHFDKELAQRYKRMSKAEKEALWAQDRALQQLATNTAAALMGADPAAMSHLFSGAGAAAAAGPASLAASLAAMQQQGGAAGALSGPSLAASLAAMQQQQHAARASLNDPLGMGSAASALQRVLSTGALDAYMTPGSAAMAAAQAHAGMFRVQSHQGLGGLLNGPHQHTAASAVAKAAAAQQLLQQQVSGLLSQHGAAAGNVASQQLLQRQMSELLNQHAQQHPSGPGALPLTSVQGLDMFQQALLQQQLAGMGSSSNLALLQQQQQQVQLQQQLLAAQRLGSAGGAAAAAAPLPWQQQQVGLQQPSLQQQQGLLQRQGRQIPLNLQQALSAAGMPQMPAGDPQLVFNSMQASRHPQAAPAAPLGGGTMALGQMQQAPEHLQQQQQQQPQLGGMQQSFLCPLSRVAMTDPVIASDGLTYERAAITDWMQQHDVSPMTGQLLTNRFLAPNYQLRNAMMQEMLR